MGVYFLYFNSTFFFFKSTLFLTELQPPHTPNTMCQKINSDSAFASALRSAAGKSVLLDFYADWCGPCKAISPTVDSLATANPNIVFLKVNVDTCTETAAQYQIKSMPTFVGLDPAHRVVSQISGASEAPLRQLVASLPAERFVGQGRSLKSEGGGGGGGGDVSASCTARLVPQMAAGSTDCVTLQLTTTAGKAERLSIPGGTTVEALYGHVKAATNVSSFHLVCGFPQQKPLLDGRATVKAAGLHRAQVRQVAL